jgi:hypothetical protein
VKLQQNALNDTNNSSLPLLEHVFKKMCLIEIVPLSARPSVPYFFDVQLSESSTFRYKLKTMYIPRVRLEFSIQCLEVVGLVPEPYTLQMGFFHVLELKFSQNWNSCAQNHGKC